jgi:hypothetical protein
MRLFPSRSSRALTAATLAALPAASAAAASNASFATAVTDYTMGNVFIAAPNTTYNQTAAAVGAPNPIVGSGAFAGNLSPFNSHYETSDLVAIGRGGSITLQFGSAVPVISGPELNVVTNVYLVDAGDFMAGTSGTASSPARTSAFDEYGAERTALVEVATTPGDWRTVGRVKFDKPANAYASATGPYDFPPTGAVEADFGKPFTGSVADFSGKNFGDILTLLDGSAGGTWIDVPANLGLSSFQYVRFSDTLWQTPDGTTFEQRTSGYNPAYVKPADLFIDAVAAVPEPAGAAVVAVAALAGLCRRRVRGNARA